MTKPCWLLVALLALFPLTSNAAWLSDAQDIMGTRISVELWSEDESQGQQAIELVMAEMRRIEQQLSPYIDSSELSRLNKRAASGAVSISEKMYRLLDKSLYYSRISDGAFDISFASVGRFYDYREEKQPNESEVAANLSAIDYRAIQLDKKAKTVRFNHPQLKIDMGGIAKGYAVDNGIEILKGQGIVAAIVSAGGDSRILGDRGGRPWVMGIRHPRKKDGFAIKIPLADTALSTSGDYERFFIKDDERVHHILNPGTGRSATGVQSVSILSPLAIDSDALSTTVFVLGVKKGLALVNKLPGIDAVIIDNDGKLHYSDELLLPVKN